MNVLLATYNGSKFLREQLDSIESQTLPVARITVRDDGSADGTLSLLQEWTAGRPDVHLLLGPRLGVTKNFFALLASQDNDSEYFAFSDQDDVWLPGKIERAVARLEGCRPEEPALYGSRVEYVSDKLDHLGYSRIPKRVGFANALVENFATGCTMVLNRSARDLICARLPANAMIHDWWCYLVVSAFGGILYDEWPSVKYRQHGSNHTGGTSSVPDLFKRRLKRFLNTDRHARLLSGQALEFERCFGDILPQQPRAMLARFLTVRDSLLRRFGYSSGMDVWRQSTVDTAILRALILLGRV